MHSDADAGDKVAEEQANQFAAAFFIPANEIKSELPSKVDWPQLLAWRMVVVVNELDESGRLCAAVC
jgi:hypothetical protein